MQVKKGFDSDKFVRLESREISKRASKFDRIYLEFGGHLCYDGHASRVLPGYRPEAKLEIIERIKDIEVIYCVSSRDIESRKRLGDFRLSYTEQTLRDLKSFKKHGINVSAVVITMFSGQSAAMKFSIQLRKLGYSVYILPEIKDYLKGPRYAVNGYKKYDYINVNSKIVVVTGAAGGSGKMATAMSQVYHDLKSGVNAGYAKVESFPVYNLPISHPVNIAYEAATADLGDFLVYDPYHFAAYNKKAVNYNRDVKNFSILRDIARIITKEKFPFGYKSPTDMGINLEKSAITDDSECRNAANAEIVRRNEFYSKEFKKGRESAETLRRMKQIMKKAKIFL